MRLTGSFYISNIDECVLYHVNKRFGKELQADLSFCSNYLAPNKMNNSVCPTGEQEEWNHFDLDSPWWHPQSVPSPVQGGIASYTFMNAEYQLEQKAKSFWGHIRSVFYILFFWIKQYKDQVCLIQTYMVYMFGALLMSKPNLDF